MHRRSTGAGVKMDKGLNLSSHTVVETSSVVAVDETISNPLSSGNGVTNLIQEIEGSIHSILGRDLSHGNCRSRDLSIVTQNVRRILTGNENEVARVRPVHLLGSYVNLSDEFTRVPIVKEHSRISPLDSQQVSSKQALRARSGRLNGTTLLKVLKELDPVDRFTNGIVSRTSSRPYKVNSLPESLVTKSLGSVDDELPISANGDKTPIAIVFDRLGVQLTSTEIPRNHRKTLPIRKCILVISPRQSPHGGSLNLVILCPNHLSSSIHRHHRLIRPEFNHHTPLIKPNGKFGSLPRSSQCPRPLHPVIQRGLCTIRRTLPQPHGTIFRGRANKRKFGMEQHRTHIVRVSIQRVHNRFRLIVPNLDGAIICPR
mmetsp:Transcript_10824/g.23797  ORF Transcript_10824/g.23797 Transcript_10824/m.23797 type:complete len:372 (+) Transcript_10824:2953-4068(+)